jgi:hypothetical protein
MGVLLAVGDWEADVRLRDLLAETGGWLGDRGWRLRFRGYQDSSPRLGESDAAAMLFFPHRFWRDEVESRPTGLYGNRLHGGLLKRYLVRNADRLRRQVPGVRFLNEAAAVGLSRDKIEVKRCWLAAGVPTPRPVLASGAAELAEAVRRLGRVYVKAPCGSMGKGITVLAPGRWQTNFAWRDGELGAPEPGDPQYGGADRWAFTDVDPADGEFLAALCRTPGLLMEEGVADAALAGERIELRVTVLRGEVVRTEPRSAAAGSAVTRPAGPIALPAAVSDQVDHAARTAATALGVRYAVFDIVLDAGLRPYVLDAQTFPASDTRPETLTHILAALTGGPEHSHAAVLLRK